jgi:UDP-N-acetylmuramate--alanine ligase
VHYIPDKKNVPSTLLTLTKPNDIVITMGAGDIWKYGAEFLQQLMHQRTAKRA